MASDQAVAEAPPVAVLPFMLHVRYEQGRGDGGVPKTWVPVWGPISAGRNPVSIETITALAVETFRILCRDESAHGRDLMPSTDATDYRLHQVDGGRITDRSQLRWFRSPQGFTSAEAVLTWGEPNCHLGATDEQ